MPTAWSLLRVIGSSLPALSKFTWQFPCRILLLLMLFTRLVSSCWVLFIPWPCSFLLPFESNFSISNLRSFSIILVIPWGTVCQRWNALKAMKELMSPGAPGLQEFPFQFVYQKQQHVSCQIYRTCGKSSIWFLTWESIHWTHLVTWSETFHHQLSRKYHLFLI